MVKTGMPRRSVLIVLAAAVLSGCAATGKTATATTPDAAGTTGAQAAFEAALRAYEQENLKPLEALLPARFIGRSVLLEAAQGTFNEQKQIRVTLSEVRLQPGAAGVAALSARWDKRYLKLPGLTASAETGSLQAVMRLDAGQWVMDSLSPDNPFSR